MKANAPEKIYVSDYGSGLTYFWHNKRLSVNDIEYVRKDAFIEKVAKWINEHTSLSKKMVIENFVNYMKGE